MFADDFAGRILPFEATATGRYADIVVARRQAGNPIEGFDALIAATALGVGASPRGTPLASQAADSRLSIRGRRRECAGFYPHRGAAAPLAGESLDGCQVAWARRLDAG
jgi:hypothetical protein